MIFWETVFAKRQCDCDPKAKQRDPIHVAIAPPVRIFSPPHERPIPITIAFTRGVSAWIDTINLHPLCVPVYRECAPDRLPRWRYLPHQEASLSGWSRWRRSSIVAMNKYPQRAIDRTGAGIICCGIRSFSSVERRVIGEVEVEGKIKAN